MYLSNTTCGIQTAQTNEKIYITRFKYFLNSFFFQNVFSRYYDTTFSHNFKMPRPGKKGKKAEPQPASGKGKGSAGNHIKVSIIFIVGNNFHCRFKY